MPGQPSRTAAVVMLAEVHYETAIKLADGRSGVRVLSDPFIIWTMQRTGGTALTEMLMEMSEHRSAEHEPFGYPAKPRQFWPVSEAWIRTRNAGNLRRSLQEILSQKYLIKHCYELHNQQFNEILMEVASRTPVSQILLLRRDEYSRLISKYVAETQGVWFKDYATKVFDEVAEGQRELQPLPVEKMIAHYRHCRSATQAIRDELARLGVDYQELYYEDLYSGDRESRLDRTHELLDCLGFTPKEIARNANLIEEKIFGSGQNTKGVTPFVPNLAQVNEALAAEGCYPCSSDDESEEQIGERSQGNESAMRETLRTKPTSTPDPPSGSSPEVGSKGPRARVLSEIHRLVEAFDAGGPVLEIAADLRDLATPTIDRFHSLERHVVGVGENAPLGGVTFHPDPPHDLRARFSDGTFSTVISNRALSRDPRFWQTADEIRRVLAPGGLAIFIAPCFSKAPSDSGVIVVGHKGNPFTGATITAPVGGNSDYWRISPQALRHVIMDGFDVREVRVKMTPPHVFGIGVKPA